MIRAYLEAVNELNDCHQEILFFPVSFEVAHLGFTDVPLSKYGRLANLSVVVLGISQPLVQFSLASEAREVGVLHLVAGPPRRVLLNFFLRVVGGR